MTAPAHRGRRDNGLDSETFAPVADIDPRLGDHLLDVLGLREIAAYVEPAPAIDSVVADRLFVAAHLTDAARGIVDELANELGIEISRNRRPDRPRAERDGHERDLLDGVDTDSAFAAIVANLPDLDRPMADSPSTAFLVALEREHADAAGLHDDTIDEVDHYIPPPPPPLPKLAAITVFAVLTVLLGIVVIAAGGPIGLPADLPLPLGVVLILSGGAMLFQRLRPRPDDDYDDGAVV